MVTVVRYFRMVKPLHTILGSGGSIGTGLAAELNRLGCRVRLVARNPESINSDDELRTADLTNTTGIDALIEGSAVVYITVGFAYKTSVWQKVWPAFMQAVIDGCLKHQAKLVFVDNMYAYATATLVNMTEDSRIDPQSKKGKVRALLHQMIFEAIEHRNLKAIIARAADFYGPGIGNSALSDMVAKNLKKGKKAMWLGSTDKIHQFTWTPDAAKGTALLGTSDDTWNQVWHLPTANVKWTMKDWATAIAAPLGVKPAIAPLSDFALIILGIFIPVLREIREMDYQNLNDYVFDSGKFNRRFEFTPTPPETAIPAMLKALE